MNEFLKLIRESFTLLDLEKDYDNDGANIVDKNSLFYAQKFLYTLACDPIQFFLPEINCLRDGGIDVSFRNEENKYRLLICFHSNKISWYGDNGYDKDRLKGSVEYMVFDNDNKIKDWILKNFSKPLL